MYDNFLQINKVFTNEYSLSFSIFEKRIHPTAKGELRKPQ